MLLIIVVIIYSFHFNLNFNAFKICKNLLNVVSYLNDERKQLHPEQITKTNKASFILSSMNTKYFVGECLLLRVIFAACLRHQITVSMVI